MSGSQITIDGVEIDINKSKPLTHKGRFSGKDLAGIELNIAVNKAAKEIVNNLFEKGTVDVYDPFAKRAYKAKISLSTSIERDGNSPMTFEGTVSEIDTWATYDVVEINGVEFPVMKCKEHLYADDDVVALFALLKLDRKQFEAITKQLATKNATVRRIGVDNEAQQLRFGGAQYWSRHEENGETYFKQIVRFLPVDYYHISPLIGYDHQISALKDLTKDLYTRFQTLSDMVEQNGAITSDQRQQLLGNTICALDEFSIIENIDLRLRQVKDAEKELL